MPTPEASCVTSALGLAYLKRPNTEIGGFDIDSRIHLMETEQNCLDNCDLDATCLAAMF